MTGEPTSTPESKPVSSPRSAQDRKMEKDIIGAEQLARILPTETDLAAELAEGGSPDRTGAVFSITAAGPGRLYRSRRGRGDTKNRHQNLQSADKSARAAYSKLRGLGKSAFMKDPEGRQFVGLDGREPDSLPNFIGAARNLANSGSRPGYAEKLAKKGVTAARLADLSAKLDALEAADAAQEAAKAAAPKARVKRDASAQEISDWIAEFKTFASPDSKIARTSSSAGASDSDAAVRRLQH